MALLVCEGLVRLLNLSSDLFVSLLLELEDLFELVSVLLLSILADGLSLLDQLHVLADAHVHVRLRFVILFLVLLGPQLIVLRLLTLPLRLNLLARHFLLLLSLEQTQRRLSLFLQSLLGLLVRSLLLSLTFHLNSNPLLRQFLALLGLSPLMLHLHLKTQ